MVEYRTRMKKSWETLEGLMVTLVIRMNGEEKTEAFTDIMPIQLARQLAVTDVTLQVKDSS